MAEHMLHTHPATSTIATTATAIAAPATATVATTASAIEVATAWTSVTAPRANNRATLWQLPQLMITMGKVAAISKAAVSLHPPEGTHR